MAWPKGSVPAPQTHSFRERGYVPVHDLSCIGGVEDPQRLIALSWEHRKVVGSGKDACIITEDIAESLKTSRVFVMARNLALGATVFAQAEEGASFMEVVPPEIKDPATLCAQTIVANQCPMYYFANGALRLKG